ncbi:putative RNA polymerase ECF-subfamily sigma factor [Streptomyces sp. Tu6071]|nr:putative RNA polymerase ECF-subfamily sigma factor [Streptomyces sp. Tu6071]
MGSVRRLGEYFAEPHQSTAALASHRCLAAAHDLSSGFYVKALDVAENDSRPRPRRKATQQGPQVRVVGVGLFRPGCIGHLRMDLLTSAEDDAVVVDRGVHHATTRVRNGIPPAYTRPCQVKAGQCRLHRVLGPPLIPGQQQHRQPDQPGTVRPHELGEFLIPFNSRLHGHASSVRRVSLRSPLPRIRKAAALHGTRNFSGGPGSRPTSDRRAWRSGSAVKTWALPRPVPRLYGCRPRRVRPPGVAGAQADHGAHARGPGRSDLRA